MPKYTFKCQFIHLNANLYTFKCQFIQLNPNANLNLGSKKFSLVQDFILTYNTILVTFRDITKGKSSHAQTGAKTRSKIQSARFMLVPDPSRNWRHKNGIWYYVKEMKKTHRGDYDAKFLQPAIKKWKKSQKKHTRNQN